MKRKNSKIFLTGAVLTSLLMGVSSINALAADTTVNNSTSTNYGYFNGQQKNADRHTQYESIAGFTTDEEREAYFEANGLGGKMNNDKEHFDIESLISIGIINEETADQIAEYAAKKHENIHSYFEQTSNMTSNQRHELYNSSINDSYSGNLIDELVDNGILTNTEANAINDYLIDTEE